MKIFFVYDLSLVSHCFDHYFTHHIYGHLQADVEHNGSADAEAAEAMLEFFPDADVETLKIVANSYRKTDSWMADPIMTEEAFTRLQDIIDINGELKARVEFGELVDNSFAEAVVKGK